MILEVLVEISESHAGGPNGIDFLVKGLWTLADVGEAPEPAARKTAFAKGLMEDLTAADVLVDLFFQFLG